MLQKCVNVCLTTAGGRELGFTGCRVRGRFSCTISLVNKMIINALDLFHKSNCWCKFNLHASIENVTYYSSPTIVSPEKLILLGVYSAAILEYGTTCFLNNENSLAPSFIHRLHGILPTYITLTSPCANLDIGGLNASASHSYPSF